MKTDPESLLVQDNLIEANASTENDTGRKTSTNLPDKLYTSFIGRENEIDKLLNVLRSPTTLTLVGIDGFGGIGKTALAREVVDLALQERLFHWTIWITAKRSSIEANDVTVYNSAKITFSSVVEELGSLLGLSPELRKIHKMSEKERIVKEALDASPGLIVLDNLETADEDQEQITQKVARLLNPSKAIMTSRYRWQPTSNIVSLSLSGLSESESVRLMKSTARSQNIERVIQSPNESLVPIAQATGGLPLALKLATGLLATQDMTSLVEALRTISTQEIYLLYRYLLFRSWQQLEEPHKDILFALAQFSDDIGADIQDLIAVSAIDKSDFGDVMNRLIRLSLVEVTGDIRSTRYSLHPLTINFIKSDLLGHT